MELLEQNLFFNSLTKTYRKRYQEVIDNCYHLCIPVNGSFDPKQINEKFITSHILKPSPLLKSHFLPYNSKQNFHVQIDNNYIRVTKGFGDQNHTSIRILCEEKAYNNSNKSYSIFICELPLIPSLNCKLNYETADNVSQDIELVQFEDCEKFLKSISSAELVSLKSKITELIKTYIILPDYIDDVACKLKKIIDHFILIFSSHYSKNPKYRNHKELLSSMIESFSIGLIYEKLFTAIKQKFHNEDDDFVRKTNEIKKNQFNPSMFGAQKAFENFTIPRYLIESFLKLDEQSTPLAKLNCMRKTLDSINERLKKAVDEQKSPFDKNNDPVYIMSDDLLATVICVLATCEPKAFCSNIKFIHTFSWYLPQNSELGYSLVTFEVANEYIQNYKADDSVAKKSLPSKYQPKSYHKANDAKLTDFDHQIDKITKMLESSDIKCERQNSTSKTNQEELGSFLGSLAGGFFTSSGQKN